MRLITVLFVALSLHLSAATPALAQDTKPPAKLMVAVASCPPFVIVDGDNYSGLAIHLWSQIAQHLDVTYDYVEYPLSELLNAFQHKIDTSTASTDAAISCISITKEREEIVDFTHSFYETYTGVAVRKRGLTDLLAAFFTNTTILAAIGLVLAVAAVVGIIFFLLEHRINPKLYSMDNRFGLALESLIIGILFITRGPIRFYEFKTLTARVLSAVLAIGSTFLIAGTTAILASAVTLKGIESQVANLQDLQNVRVGALEASTSSAFLHKNGITHRSRPDLESLVRDLDAGTLDAVVADAAFLKDAIRRGQAAGKYDQLSVLPQEFDTQNYGFALVPDSPYREGANRALLSLRKGQDWRDMLAKYLGE